MKDLKLTIKKENNKSFNTSKEENKMKKTIIKSILIIFFLLVTTSVSSAWNLGGMANVNTYIPQSYNYNLSNFWDSYLNSRQPDFRVKDVSICYRYVAPERNSRAYVYTTIENIGGNAGIVDGSEISYGVRVNCCGLLYDSAAPYRGESVSFSEWQWIWSTTDQRTVRIEIMRNSSLPEMNYANNISRWEVDTPSYVLSGCYDMVQVY